MSFAYNGVSVAQWRASEHEIPRFEVQFHLGNQNFFFVPSSQRDKNIFLYFFTELKTYYLFNSNQHVYPKMVKGGRGPSFLLACWCTRSWVGIISAQPHAIVKQIRFPKGKVLFLSLFSLSKNCMHGVVLGCA